MKQAIALLGCFISSVCMAQNYSTLLIPDSLRKNAAVVNRYEEYVLTIKTPAKYRAYEKHVYTILNAAADGYANYKTYYDRFNSINYVAATMFNGTGEKIKQAKKSDWKDYSAYDGYSLLSDSRYRENDFYSADYPYTVQYEEEDEYTSTQGFTTWRPQHIPGMSVQFSKFTIIAPADYVVRYKQVNFPAPPLITRQGDLKTYTWEIKNLPCLQAEKGAPSFSEIAASVIFAPSQFEVDGYKGDMTTWEGYGKFMFQLIKERDVLPEEIKRKVHELTDHLVNEKEKIYTLYNYLQQNTRYISVQLGIGGWQPFEASYVAKNKYGDCKALSNYMIALLKEAGITGKYAEIYGGSYPPAFIEDFPYSQSNHVICCVPLAADTVWLECTSQTVSPGYMGSFTGNRKAILIDETGGHVVNTPVYKAGDNMRLGLVKATADEEGNLTADIQNGYTGLQQELPHSLMYEVSKEERETYLNSMFNIPTYQVIKSEYRENKGMIPSIHELLQIKLSNYASLTGKRLFINPNIFGRTVEKLVADTARKYDYIITNSYRDIDSIEIKIPAGYIAETTPAAVSLNTKFGTYISTVKFSGDKIIYYRLLEQNAGRFTAREYNDLVKFYEQVSKSEKSKMVFVKPG